MESRVRTQKSVALSSGESEFVVAVAGCSDGLLIKRLWMQMTGEECQMKVRSVVQRQGIGRVRHLDASFLWVQQKEKDKALSTAAILTELNCADIGAKNLTRERLFGLLYMLKMVNATRDRVGEYEYQELEREEKMKRAMKKILKDKNLHVGMIMLLSNLYRAAGVPVGNSVRGGETTQAIDWMWIVFVACVCGLCRTRGPEHDEVAMGLHQRHLPGLGVELYGKGHGNQDLANRRLPEGKESQR